MKKLILLLLLIPSFCQAQTIGIKKQVTLKDGTVGEFLRIESVTQIDCGDSTLFKIDFALYKSQALYENSVTPMPFRYEKHVYKPNSEAFTRDQQYSYCLASDTIYLKNGTLITKNQ